MSIAEVEPRIDTFVDERTLVETAALGFLTEEEFVWAQTVAPDFNEYADYQDWVDDREGLKMGLAMAGVDVKVVPTPLSIFLTWCRLSGLLPSERQLNAFAATRLALKEATAAVAFVRRRDFDTHRDEVEAFARQGDYETWLRHREAIRRSACADVKELPVHVGDFLAWSRCLGEDVSETSLDCYATLAMNFLVHDFDDDRR